MFNPATIINEKQNMFEWMKSNYVKMCWSITWGRQKNENPAKKGVVLEKWHCETPGREKMITLRYFCSIKNTHWQEPEIKNR